VEGQNPAFLAQLGDRILAAHRRLGRAGEGLQLLTGYLASYPSVDLLGCVIGETLEVRGVDAARELLREELRRNPTLIGLNRLIEIQIAEAPAERRQDLELMRNLIQQHSRHLSLYRCDGCGFRARQFYWHCPACHGWETYQPRRAEERELAA
jgi:lipopolysaccharide biosynthesis regulator YciM